MAVAGKAGLHFKGMIRKSKSISRFLMDPSAHFRIALSCLLSEQGRGAQARLADAVGISRSHLNDYLAGRKPLPEIKRAQIAESLGSRYEQMLFLGRHLSTAPDGIAEFDAEGLQNAEALEPVFPDSVLRVDGFSNPNLLKDIFRYLKFIDRIQPGMLHPMLNYLRTLEKTLLRQKDSDS